LDGSFDSESSSESEPSSHLVRNRSLQAYYEEIVSIIDQLFDVSILIRGVSRKFRVSRAAAHVERDEDGKDILPAFKHIVRLKIAGLGPYAPEWLVDRLKDAVAMRRQQFYYQRAHKRRLAGASTSFGDDTQNVSILKEPSRPMQAPQPKDLMAKPESPAAPRTEKSRSTTKTYYTIATDPIPEDTRPPSLAKPTKTEIAENIFPGPPKEPIEKAFECHQCFLILPDTFRKEELWRLLSVFFFTNS
jgi:hypothetical protein